MSGSRKLYSAKTKLKIMAKVTRVHRTDESNIGIWKEMKTELKTVNLTIRAIKSRKEFCPALESELDKCIESQRKENRKVSTVNTQ